MKFTRILLPTAVLCMAFFSSAFAQKDLSIEEIQGTKDKSEHVGETVRTIGVVTAVIGAPFFLALLRRTRSGYEL